MEYGVSQNQTSQINKSIGRIEFEINDRQMRTFQLDASQFDLLQIDSSFDQEGVYVYAGDVDLPQSVSASGKETGDIDLIWRAKKNLKRSTYVAEEDATVSITFFGRTREPASHFLSVMPAGKPLIVDGSVIGNLNVGHYDIWTFAGTVGEVVQLDAIAERFDIELSVFYQDGNRSFSGEDRSSSDLNATAKNVIFESGHYIVVASCFGDGGGGSYSLEHAAKQTPRIEFEQELEFEVQGDSSSFFAFNGKKGQSVVISIETEANTWIELLWKSEYSIQEAYEIGGGQHVLAHRLPEDGTYTISVYGVETGKYKMKLVDIGFNQP